MNLLPLAQFQFGPIANEHPETFLAVIVGFLLLLVLFFKMDAGDLPITMAWYRRTLSARAIRIEDDDKQVKQQLAEIQKLRDDYAARLETIETEAKARIDAAVREAENTRTEIIAEAQQAARAVQRRVEEEIDRERTRQRIILRQQIVQTALDSAESSIRTHAEDNVQRRLIQDFIGRTADMAGTGTATSNTTTGQGGAS